MVLLAADPIAQTDPLYVILMWCAAAVGALANVVGLLLYARLKHVEQSVDGLHKDLTGHPEGMYARQVRLEEASNRTAAEIVRLRSDMGEFKGEIRGEFRGEFSKLEQGTLRADVFKSEMNAQNRALADLKEQVGDVEHKVDRALVRGASYESPFPRRPDPPGPKRGP